MSLDGKRSGASAVARFKAKLQSKYSDFDGDAFDKSLSKETMIELAESIIEEILEHGETETTLTGTIGTATIGGATIPVVATTLVHKGKVK